MVTGHFTCGITLWALVIEWLRWLILQQYELLKLANPLFKHYLIIKWMIAKGDWWLQLFQRKEFTYFCFIAPCSQCQNSSLYWTKETIVSLRSYSSYQYFQLSRIEISWVVCLLSNNLEIRLCRLGLFLLSSFKDENILKHVS